MRRARFFALFLLGIPLALLLGVQHVFAQQEQPPASAQVLTIFTAYPAQEVALGESVAFDLKLRGGDALQVVRLSVESLPEAWTATFRGGGKIIEAAYVDPQAEEDTTVQLNITPPKDVAANTYRFAVLASGEGAQARLPIELTVKEKLPPSLAFTVAQPTIQGTPETTFSYNATLKNEGDEDLTVNLVAQAPQGFQVNFKLAGQQVTNVPLTASESKSLTIEAKAFDRVAADTYQFDVQAQSDKAQAETSLVAYVVGQPQLTLTAPDGRLSGEAYVGNTTPFTLLLQNSGSAPARNIKLSASPPSGWSVTFTPDQIPEVPSGQQVEVTADIKPTDQAVAGDYMVSMSAQPEGSSSKSVDFRITVLTSTLWGIAGVALIAVAVVVVGLAVMRFGRR
jgi:uncharacterized repeat protein (TIGR01451 family)